MAIELEVSAAQAFAEHAEKLTDPLGVNKLAKSMTSVVDKIRGPFGDMERALRRADFANSMLPASVRMAIEMQERFDRIADPLGMRRYAGIFEHQIDLHRAFGASTRAVDFANQFSKLHGPAWLAADSFKSIRAALPSFGFEQSAAAQLAAFQKSMQMIHGAFGPDSFDAEMRWHDHMRRYAIPAINFLALPHADPIGILSDVEDDDGATVAWLRDGRDGPRVTTANILPAIERGAPFEIECEVRCLVCDREMLVTRSAKSWLGRNFRVRLEVVPMCIECLKEHGFDPEWWTARLNDIAERRPMLRTIEGSREGDGKPKGTLRLVPLPDDEP